jgi:hypothetical protein
MSQSEWDDAHHIRSAKRPERTLCGQDAAHLTVLSAGTTVWPDGNAACWTCWDMRRQILNAQEFEAI